MNFNRNYLNTDNNRMERNLRFVNNDLERNLNQYFGGSGGSGTNMGAPPRDYQVVQPKPGNDYYMKERQEFLLQLGMSFNEACVLAQNIPIDVTFFQQRRFNMLNSGMLIAEVNARLLTYFRELNYRNTMGSNNSNSTSNNSNWQESSSLAPPPAPRRLNWNAGTISQKHGPGYIEDAYPSTSRGLGNAMLYNTPATEQSQRLSGAGQCGMNYLIGPRQIVTPPQTIMVKQMAIIATNYPKTLLPIKQMQLIRSNLRMKFSTARNPSMHGNVLECKLRIGYVRVLCENPAKLRWLRASVQAIKLTDDTRLRVVEESTLPDPKMYLALFPHSAKMRPKEILEIVQEQNTKLNVPSWRILQVGTLDDKAKFTLSVDPQSAEIIDVNGMYISYKFGQVLFKPLKRSFRKAEP